MDLRTLIASAGLLFGCASLSLSAQDLTKDQVLDKIDQQAARLKTLDMAIEVKNWSDILEEFDKPEKGSLLILRENGKTFLRRQIDIPQTSILVVKDGRALFYQPLIKQAASYEIGKRKDGVANIFVGFGTDRKTLEERFEVRLRKRETIGEVEAYVLEMTPRSEKIRAEYSQFVLWFDPARWLPVRQVILLPNDDYQLMDFSDIVLNGKISKSKFKLDLPKDVVVKNLGP